MASKRYYWFKLFDDFFEDKRIKALRRKENGDRLLVIYLKLLASSVKTKGVISFEGFEDDFASEVAMSLDEEVADVCDLLDFLLKFKIMKKRKGKEEYILADMDQAIGSEGMSAERVRRHREKKRMEQGDKTLEDEDFNEVGEGGDLLQCNGQALQCNGQALQCNDIKRRKKEDINKEIKKKKNNILKSGNAVKVVDVSFDRTPVFVFVKKWNGLGGKVGKLDCECLRVDQYERIARLIELYGQDDVFKALGMIKKSSFLLGKSDKNFAVSLGWFSKPDVFERILGGEYSDYKRMRFDEVDFDDEGSITKKLRVEKLKRIKEFREGKV